MNNMNNLKNEMINLSQQGKLEFNLWISKNIFDKDNIPLIKKKLLEEHTDTNIELKFYNQYESPYLILKRIDNKSDTKIDFFTKLVINAETFHENEKIKIKQLINKAIQSYPFILDQMNISSSNGNNYINYDQYIDCFKYHQQLIYQNNSNIIVWYIDKKLYWSKRNIFNSFYEFMIG
jgi:hypothetical protein